MLADSNGNRFAGGDAPKLRTACENCRQSKVKCNLSGKNVCTRCLRHGLQCQYGFANRSGKPKGSKNRATLRKLGQLQEDKPIRGCRNNRLGPPVTDCEPLVTAGFPAHIADSMVDDDVCLFPDPPSLWDSPRGFSAASLETPICPSQLTPVDGSPFADLVDPCPPLPVGLGYPHTPVTPTCVASDPLGDGLASPRFGGPVSSPYLGLASCECVDMQLFHMNRLNHLLAESLPLRFDHSLQTIKATFCAGQVFLRCRQCAKDSANLLLLISVLNLTLQLFEYWISRETSRVPRAQHGVDIRYGCYEVCHEENLQIGTFLLRGLLLQCREVLSLLTTCVNTSYLDGHSSTESKTTTDDPDAQPWSLSDQLGSCLPELDPRVLRSSPGNSCLLPIIAGYEATVAAFLQSVSVNECICGS
ncbi:uncharacterized protein N7482_003502 [Penicillium canariense]|uniref:Zn(2)-C6 fungal-type domain-containing protein n=1 Tax=Penicillium canariense TaxID=189055 RepID=A0A9W9I6X0_9EURO|nr:uncharacterized protein N7482_003502 [Penicillium canariense]KAJ5167908.1 hypothetical protein N7482_003502 [Penicillium canariense]